MHARTALLTLVLAIPCPVLARTLTVGRPGTAEFTSISAAMASAREGDWVEVGPGRWRELVELKSGVSLQGAGAQETVLEFDRGSAVIVGKGVRSIRIAGFTLQHDAGARPCLSPVIGCDACDQLVIASNTILGSGFIGIHLSNAGFVKIESNRIAENSEAGIWAIGVRNLQVVDNDVADNDGSGMVMVATEGAVLGNRLSDNPRRGVLVGRSQAKASRVLVDGNEIRGSRLPVVELGHPADAQVDFRSNTCPGSVGGLYVFPYQAPEFPTEIPAPSGELSSDYLDVRPVETGLLRVLPCVGPTPAAGGKESP